MPGEKEVGGEVEKSLGSLRCNERSAAAVTGRITHPLLGVSTSAAASPPCQRGPGSLAGVGAGVPRERRVLSGSAGLMVLLE
ncbi:unnamed protein product [Gadus morhua 'NCC']